MKTAFPVDDIAIGSTRLQVTTLSVNAVRSHSAWARSTSIEGASSFSRSALMSASIFASFASCALDGDFSIGAALPLEPSSPASGTLLKKA